ncbi:MAG TPA: hypothetical protein VMV83_13585 [Rectinemataceae bacterium]|nr:hypothetical protein [Rectinemataceae bacterium]
MSEPRIALVAEGPTDYEVINAAMRAILRRPFVLTMLQPEATRPEFGNGWGGVLKWCRQAGESGYDSLDSYPPLAGFDAVVIHIDADVASRRYSDCGPYVEDLAIRNGWQTLPFAEPCPPPLPAVERLELSIAGWLGSARAGRKAVFCVPSKSTGAWLAAAYLPPGHLLLADAECDLNLEAQLSYLPLDQKIKKTTAVYRGKAPLVTSKWNHVKSTCSLAERFEASLRAHVPAL